MARLRVFAPAKINLALHVVGQRADGYHLLDTLVGFASVGDWITLDTDKDRGLSILGPEGGALDAAAPNLVLQTAMEFWGKGRGGLGLTLDKHLPISSGIGGGSADAAATFRGLLWLMEHMGKPLTLDIEVMKRLLSLGADVPMCLTCDPARVQGIGERIVPLDGLAKLPLVLVNPRVQVATPTVFKALTDKTNPAMSTLPADLGDAQALTLWLAGQRNDLQAPAIALAPVIGTVLDRLAATSGCTLSRMSGSGATCFGIFPDAAQATDAAARIAQDNPGWWVRAAVLDGQDRAAPEPIS